MKITVVTEDGRTAMLEASGVTQLGDLKAMISCELGVPPASQGLMYNGQPVLASDTTTLASLRFEEDSLVMLSAISQHSMPPSSNSQAGTLAGPASGSSGQGIGNFTLDLSQFQGGTPQQSQQSFMQQQTARAQAELRQAAMQLFQRCQADKHFTQQLSARNSQFKTAIDSNNFEQFFQAFRTENDKLIQERKEHEERMRRLMANPDSAEAQAEIEKEIQQANVLKNREEALEYNPEAFASVIMLYFEASVNGNPVKAFLDTGAQMTIMSEKMATECGLIRLMDTQFQGMAVGVGQSRILGRVHMAPMVIGKKHIPIAISILEGDSMGFIFGLDNLKRHQCVVDLNENCLRFHDEVIPFLAEKDIPKKELMLGRSGSSGSVTPSEGQTPKSSAGGSGAQTSLQPNHATASSHESGIQYLIDLGASRPQAVDLMRRANGNVDAAVALLFPN